ncbi:Inositol phosphatase SIW14 [Microbotryomycetes sp. JL221]|nr:Inositol phosphatase SIW14 [Microbotryomycetes sp. JL221]
MSTSAASLLDELKQIRSKSIHNPHRVVEIGQQLLERRFATKRGDQGQHQSHMTLEQITTGTDMIEAPVWTVLEQIGSAAAECGHFDLAEVCASRLDAQFPASPRVALLMGSIAEAKGDLELAQRIYNQQLKSDQVNTAVRKRLIALHLYSPTGDTKGKGSATGLSKNKGIDMLVQFLDTFYNDTDGWIQLAEAYQSLQMYSQSLSALSHLILLAPFNPFYVLWHAETAYTLQDFNLAYKQFLRVIELTEQIESNGGVGTRAAFGVKLCLARINSSKSVATTKPNSANDTSMTPQHGQDIDLVITKALLNSYSHTQATTKAEVREWLGDKGVTR